MGEQLFRFVRSMNMTCAGNDVAGAESCLDIPLHLEAEDSARSAGRNGGADTKVHGSEGVDSTLEVTMSTQDAKVRSTLAQRELTSSCAAKKGECVRGRRGCTERVRAVHGDVPAGQR